MKGQKSSGSAKGGEATKAKAKAIGSTNVWRTFNRLRREPLAELIKIADKLEDTDKKIALWKYMLEMQEIGIEKTGAAGAAAPASQADLVKALEAAGSSPKPGAGVVTSDVKTRALDGSTPPTLGGGSAPVPHHPPAGPNGVGGEGVTRGPSNVEKGAGPIQEGPK